MNDNAAAREPGLLHHRLFWLLMLLGVYIAIPNARPDWNVFNIEWSESTVALARNIGQGRGYTRALPPEPYQPYTRWPPALPLLLTPATLLGQERVDWFAIKSVMISIGVLGIVASWALARRLTGSRAAADLASLALALNPLYWAFSHIVMPEIPIVVSLVLGALLIDRAWRGRRLSYLGAVLTGVIAGSALLVRYPCVGLALTPLPYVLSRSTPQQAGESAPTASIGVIGSWPRKIALYVVFLIGFSAPAALWELERSRHDATGFDGFREVHSQYFDAETGALRPWPDIGRDMIFHAKTRPIYYISRQAIPGVWPHALLNWKGSGVIAITLCAVVILASLPYVRGLWPIWLTIIPFPLLHLPRETTSAPRFWIPASMLMTMIIAAQLGAWSDRWSPRARRGLLAATLLIGGLNLGAYIVSWTRDPFQSKETYPELALVVEQFARLDLDGAKKPVVFSPCALGFQLTTGRYAPMFDALALCSHAILREDGLGPPIPPGSKRLFTVAPWTCLELPREMSAKELHQGREWDLRRP